MTRFRRILEFGAEFGEQPVSPLFYGCFVVVNLLFFFVLRDEHVLYLYPFGMAVIMAFLLFVSACKIVRLRESGDSRLAIGIGIFIFFVSVAFIYALSQLCWWTAEVVPVLGGVL